MRWPALRAAQGVPWPVAVREALGVSWLVAVREALGVPWLEAVRAALGVPWPEPGDGARIDLGPWHVPASKKRHAYFVGIRHYYFAVTESVKLRGAGIMSNKSEH